MRMDNPEKVNPRISEEVRRNVLSEGKNSTSKHKRKKKFKNIYPKKTFLLKHFSLLWPVFIISTKYSTRRDLNIQFTLIVFALLTVLAPLD